MMALLLEGCVRNGYPTQMYACSMDATDTMPSSTIGLRFEYGQVYISGDDHVYYGGIGVCPIDSRPEASRDQIFFDTELCGHPQYNSSSRWNGRFNRLTKHLELSSIHPTDQAKNSHRLYVCSKASWDPTT